MTTNIATQEPEILTLSAKFAVGDTAYYTFGMAKHGPIVNIISVSFAENGAARYNVKNMNTTISGVWDCDLTIIA